jgi:PAS domain S-box-containing protein
MSECLDLLEEIESLKNKLARKSEDLDFCERRFRKIVEHTPSGVCITDENGIFEYVNPAYCKIYGYEAEDLIGKSFLMIVPEKNRHFMEELHRKYIDGEEEVQGEWEVVDSKGQIKNIIADAARLIDGDGKKYKATFIVDITSRRGIEELRKDVERMTRHDLRSPLSSLIHLPELMRDLGPLTAEQSDLMELVRLSGKRMLNMLSMSMELFKMEEGSYAPDLKEFNLIDLLKRVFYEVTMNMNIDSSSCVLENGECLILRADESLIESLFYNLVTNAFEASESLPDKEPVKVRINCNEKEVIVDILNRGEVPPEVRETFFDKYVTSGKKKGTGIGTYMASMAAEVHGGKISLNSSVPGFTLVSVTLPRTDD